MKKEYQATNAANIHDTKGGVYTFEKALRPFRRDVQMAVIEGHSGILLMNFTTSELIFLCK